MYGENTRITGVFLFLETCGTCGEPGLQLYITFLFLTLRQLRIDFVGTSFSFHGSLSPAPVTYMYSCICSPLHKSQVAR